MNWEVEFYQATTGESPVREFLRELSKSDRVKAGNTIFRLEGLGIELRMPDARPIVSEKGLFELRFKGDDGIFRIIYFHFAGRRFVLLHAFSKKTQKTPQREIEIAKARKADYLRQKESHQ